MEKHSGGCEEGQVHQSKRAPEMCVSPREAWGISAGDESSQCVRVGRGGQRKPDVQDRKCTHIGYSLAMEWKSHNRKKEVRLNTFSTFTIKQKVSINGDDSWWERKGGKKSDGLVFLFYKVESQELVCIVNLWSKK